MMKRITILLLAALLLLSGCVNQVTPTDPEGTWGSIPVMGNNPTTAPTESDAPFVRHRHHIVDILPLDHRGPLLPGVGSVYLFLA